MFGTTSFGYTHKEEGLDSSLVDGAYYNANTRELAVDLNDKVYVYSEVPSHVFDTLVKASSPGTKFQDIKRTYGPSRRLGFFDRVNFDKVEDRTARAADMSSVGTPKGLTLATNATVTDNTSTAVTNSYTTLNFTPNAKIEVISGNTERTFSVDFVVGDSKVRTHTLKADSFGEAEAALEEIAEMLDLEFVIKEIKVVE